MASPLHLIAQPTPLAACTVQDSLGWSEALTLTTQSFETLVVSGESIGRMNEESLKIRLADFPESAAAVGCLMAFKAAGCHSTALSAALVRVACNTAPQSCAGRPCASAQPREQQLHVQLRLTAPLNSQTLPMTCCNTGSLLNQLGPGSNASAH